MNPFNWLKKSLPELLLSFMVLAILPACSSTEEDVPPPEESGSTECGCVEGDLGCKEQCVQELDI